MVQPHYYKGERGNKPYDLELMLRIHILQKLYNLADSAVMNEIIDSRAFSQFCGMDSSNQVPDGDTIGRFRHILEKNHTGERFLEQVVQKLRNCGLLLQKGTIVDPTLIAAPPPRKTRKKIAIRRHIQPKKEISGISATWNTLVWMRTAGWFTRLRQPQPMSTTAT